MSLRHNSALYQYAIRNLPALCGALGLFLLASFVLQTELGDNELLHSFGKMKLVIDFYGVERLAGVVLLNVFGLPIVGSFFRLEVDPHRAMLFLAARGLAWATVLLLPWVFVTWLSGFALLIIPIIVVVQAAAICTTLQRGAAALGAIFLSYGALALLQGALHAFICLAPYQRYSYELAALSGLTFVGYAAVAMLLGAELLRSDSEQRRSSTRGAQ